MNNDRYLNLSPSTSLAESCRDMGYSMETAVADIIDNSITAEASTVSIRFSWNSDNPWLAIIDDGHGMSKDELIAAMRFGSTDPREMRSPDDLGRFGLGMKTASLSQCRQLTVLSKKTGSLSAFAWDLDQITGDNRYEWRLGIIDTDEFQKLKPLFSLCNEYLGGKESGSIVLWQKFDKMESQSSSEAREKLFNAHMADTKEYIELFFHRFLSPDPGKSRVIISMNGDELEAFNPFNPSHPATQELEEQRFQIEGQEIVIQPYILPHHSKVPEEEYKKCAMDEGYLHNQGLYIYRNRRLIIKGTWFRLMRKDVINQLIRIRVDIPNTLDHLWRIDVKKANATPPERVRKELQLLLGKIEIKGRKVYKQRGQKIAISSLTPVWNRRAARGRTFYELNRDHPLLKQLLESAPPEHSRQLKDTMHLIESSFPADLFFSDLANDTEQIERPSLEEGELENMLDRLISFLNPDGVLSPDKIKTILTTEPFSLYRDLSQTLLERRGYVL